jgi:hypothetical protein
MVIELVSRRQLKPTVLSGVCHSAVACPCPLAAHCGYDWFVEWWNRELDLPFLCV